MHCSKTLLGAAAAALVAFLAPTGAGAQALDGTRSIDAWSGVAAGSGRVVGLGGAYVGVAEGLGGASVNPAAVAQRRPDLRRAWDLDGTLSGFVLGASEDGDNDGGRDAGLRGQSRLEAGLGFQRERLGLGLLARSWLSAGRATAQGSAGVETSQVSLCGGFSGWHDALVLGGSLTAAAGALIQYRPDGGEAGRLRYNAGELRLGALWRPRGRRFRAGAFWDPGAEARAEQGGSAPAGGPRSFHFPWTAAAGVAAWVGPNALRLNEPSPLELEEAPELGPGPPFQPTRVQPLLLSVQLDLAGPSPRAVTPASAVVEGAPPSRSGARASLVPRAGAEWEPLRSAFRVRGGGYLEPSRTGVRPRAHGTFGAEVRIPFWPWDAQVGFTGDLARRYHNLGFSLGLWGERGPAAPGGVG